MKDYQAARETFTNDFHLYVETFITWMRYGYQHALIFLASNPEQVARIQQAIAHLDIPQVVPAYLHKAKELIDLCE